MEEIVALLKSNGNKIGWIEFKKINGTMRKMCFRNLPLSRLKGGNTRYDLKAAGVYPILDIKSNQIKSVKLKNIKRMTLNKIKYVVLGA